MGIAAGANHTLALTQQGKVYTWGDNTYGQLGTAAAVTTKYARLVGAMPSGGLVTFIAAGANHSLAIHGTNRNVAAWGSNGFGQLGTNDTANKFAPTAVATPLSEPALAGVVHVAGGGNHTLAVKGTTVYAWGRNNKKQVANSAATTQLRPLSYAAGLSGIQVTQVAAGLEHSVALAPATGQTSGLLFTWGSNSDGQCSDGTLVNRATPWTVFPPFNGTGLFTTAGAGWRNTFGFKSDGTLAICGDNRGVADANGGVVGQGQCGNTAPGIAPVDQTNMIFGIVPRDVSGEVTTASSVSNNTARAYAYKPTGRSVTWGGGSSAIQGGSGTSPYTMDTPLISSYRMLANQQITAWLAYEGSITTESRSGMAGTSDGMQGNGSTMWSAAPTKVMTSSGVVLGGIVSTAFGDRHGVAVSISGAVYSWGLGPAGRRRALGEFYMGHKLCDAGFRVK